MTEEEKIAFMKEALKEAKSAYEAGEVPKRTSERIVKFHSLAQFVSKFSDNSVSSFTVSWV